jgi:serine/threonine protein kinase
MLHPKYLREGAQVEIPELSGYVLKGSPLFKVLGIHAGGMGICLHLNHNETGFQYALKGIRPDYMDDQSSIDRFFDELQVWLSASMCSLISKAIAIVRINETPCALAAWMQNGDLTYTLPILTPCQKIEVLIRMVRGLSWVHKNIGVIHRDLKPANVLFDQDNLAYIADWGLARPVGNIMSNVRASLNDRTLERPDRTQAGSFMGTVTYAAPEQILGAPDIDHRADIYAIGCMMYEFETGAPPFTGQTITEIARQHINKLPPKLGGLFKRTELGIDKVVAKCLEKRPTARPQTYEELEEILLRLGGRHGVDLNRCMVKIRYERSQLGKGHLEQNKLLKKTPIQNATTGFSVVEFDDIAPFVEEAINLMALSRYSEAEQILRPHFIPEAIGFADNWAPFHTAAVNYALCLIKLGRLEDAEKVFLRLDHNKEKPAEFYANYSLVLLSSKKWQESADVCSRGLKHFPNDPDIQGNLTIALGNIGDLDRAKESAIKRLKLRRDIHSIEEAASVLYRLARRKRDVDLPEAVSSAKIAGDLIKEGLTINPRHYPFRIQEIQLRRFAYDEERVLTLCQAMIDSDACPVPYRQIAFAEMIEKLAEGKFFNTALEMIQKVGNNLSERVLSVKMRILARHYMIGKENAKGQRVIIPEVREYYIGTNSNSTEIDTVIVAEILEWLNDPMAAVETLEKHLSKDPTDWDGVRIMALIQLRMGKHDDALHFAKSLATLAPWRHPFQGSTFTFFFPQVF